MTFHKRAGLSVTHAAYFRWLDLSILNLSTLSPGLQSMIGRLITALDWPLLAYSRQRVIVGGPPSLYSAMYAIAVNPSA